MCTVAKILFGAIPVLFLFSLTSLQACGTFNSFIFTVDYNIYIFILYSSQCKGCLFFEMLKVSIYINMTINIVFFPHSEKFTDSN